MVEIVADNGGDKKFPKEPVDKELVLSSLRDYAKNGTIFGVEKVIEPKLNAYGKVTISAILTIKQIKTYISSYQIFKMI